MWKFTNISKENIILNAVQLYVHGLSAYFLCHYQIILTNFVS